MVIHNKSGEVIEGVTVLIIIRHVGWIQDVKKSPEQVKWLKLGKTKILNVRVVDSKVKKKRFTSLHIIIIHSSVLATP